MNYFFEILIGTFAALIPIVNPFSTSSIFLSLTFFGTDKWRKKQALFATIYMFLILVGFLLFGGLIINFFGISLPGIRIAGGFLLSKMAFNMLYGNNDEIEHNKINKKDIAFFPLAMPSLAGPGAIALTISMGTFVKTNIDYLAIISAIFILAILTYFTLRFATYSKKFLNDSKVEVISKIMGFIIFCIGVQFIINGILELNL